MDYAGLMDEWITDESGGDVSFGTEFSGQVKETVLKDGNTQIDALGLKVRDLCKNTLIASIISCFKRSLSLIQALHIC